MLVSGWLVTQLQVGVRKGEVFKGVTPLLLPHFAARCAADAESLHGTNWLGVCYSFV